MSDPRLVRRELTLGNGLAVTLRHLHPEDRTRVARFVRQLEPESIYLRLFTHPRELTEADVDRFMRTHPEDEIALVATTVVGGNEIIIGGARFVRFPSLGERDHAEIAFLVEEDYQNIGLARALLAMLADVARSKGIAVFEADVLEENASMLAVFERCGLAMEKTRDGSTFHVRLAL